MLPCIVTNFFIIKITRRTNFSKVITVHSAMVCVTQVCRQPSSGIRIPLESCLKICTTHTTTECTVITPDDGRRNCPKHVVSFQNKFEKLVRLFVLIIRKFATYSLPGISSHGRKRLPREEVDLQPAGLSKRNCSACQAVSGLDRKNTV
jgi:hypothetical protein